MRGYVLRFHAYFQYNVSHISPSQDSNPQLRRLKPAPVRPTLFYLQNASLDNCNKTNLRNTYANRVEVG